MRVHAALTGLLLAVCPAIFAQVPDIDENAVSPVDAYGNVQPTLREWRSLRVFQNEAQRDALRGYQTFGRAVGERGGYLPFALPGDVWAVARRAASGTTADPSVRSA
jgi:hypothetical protein